MKIIRRKIKKILSLPSIGRYAYIILDLQDWFISITTPEQAAFIRYFKEIRQMVRVGINNHEAYQIYISVKKTLKFKGALAEVGVYQGGSAKVIYEAGGGKKLYLFDTFEGLPEVQKIDSEYFHKGQFSSSYAHIEKLFEGKNVLIAKGLFPQETGHTIPTNETFSFVNLDVDLYEGTKKCLEFFYPRMVKGGVIMCHDYVTIPGVRKAVDEFFSDKAEIVLEPSRSQALIVKFT